MGNGNGPAALHVHSHHLRISPTPQLRISALYIHIPFCVRKCPYCDFYSVAGRSDLAGAYVRALRAELRYAARETGRLSLRSVFVGGGTPTVLPAGDIAEVLDECAELFTIEAGAEITCECNPGTVDEAALGELRAAGVNRLSIGVQSLRDELGVESLYLRNVLRIRKTVRVEGVYETQSGDPKASARETVAKDAV